jgi:hypothetical protein
MRRVGFTERDEEFAHDEQYAAGQVALREALDIMRDWDMIPGLVEVRVHPLKDY